MIVPFLIVTVYNWIMFVLIMVSIFGHTKRPDSGKNEPKWKSMKTNFTIAVTLAVMFGLGWALGLAATSLPVKELTFAFQILFSIFVGAQGVLIFLFHGIRNKDIRKFWISIFPTSLVTSITFTTKSSTETKSQVAGGHSSGGSTLVHKKDFSESAEQNVYVEKPFCGNASAIDLELMNMKPSIEGDQDEKGISGISRKNHDDEEPSTEKERESVNNEFTEGSVVSQIIDKEIDSEQENKMAM